MSHTVSGCTGQCCAVFTLPPDRVAILAERREEEDLFILDMLVELQPEDVGPRLHSFGWDLDGYGPDYGAWAREKGGYGTKWLVYTCRHWNGETRRCGVYDQRPLMCRRYPNGGKCWGCSCSGGTKETITATKRSGREIEVAAA